MEQRKTTRKEVTHHLGIADNSFSTWSKRKTYPAADVIVRMAQFLGVSAEYLVFGDSPAGSIVPVRLRDIVADLAVLPDDQLQVVGLQVKLMADAARAMSGKVREA